MTEGFTDAELANILTNCKDILSGPWDYQSANWRARKAGGSSLTVTFSTGAGPGNYDVVEAAERTYHFLAATKELVLALVAEVQRLRLLIAATVESQPEEPTR